MNGTTILDLIYLGVGGFLIGSCMYTGWYTTRWEPEVRHGWAVVGIGIVITVTINVYVDVSRHIDGAWRGLNLLGYFVVALGLAMIVRERREYREERDDDERDDKGRG